MATSINSFQFSFIFFNFFKEFCFVFILFCFCFSSFVSEIKGLYLVSTFFQLESGLALDLCISSRKSEKKISQGKIQSHRYLNCKTFAIFSYWISCQPTQRVSRQAFSLKIDLPLLKRYFQHKSMCALNLQKLYVLAMLNKILKNNMHCRYLKGIRRQQKSNEI